MKFIRLAVAIFGLCLAGTALASDVNDLFVGERLYRCTVAVQKASETKQFRLTVRADDDEEVLTKIDIWYEGTHHKRQGWRMNKARTSCIDDGPAN